ncbi:gp25 [Sphingomonas phage PAU]|uniref:gp25 n=1 Tax=Sphingomonas phage PAU TaxID=1150991 RepID=UPI000257311E|nr:gp25 [Sphingomonas phage PAU]AFF28023.1 gp25 [Sphingomonas phage PAU]
MKQYLDLLNDVMTNGTDKEPSRQGMPGTRQLFGRQFSIDLKDGFPLYTTKKLSFKNIVNELNWFLKGHTSVKFLEYYKCRIWHDDSYVNYTRVANEVLQQANLIQQMSHGSDEPLINMFTWQCSLTVLESNMFKRTKIEATKDNVLDCYELLSKEEYKKMIRNWGDSIHRKSVIDNHFDLDKEVVNNKIIKFTNHVDSKNLQYSSTLFDSCIEIATSYKYHSYDIGDCGAQYGYLWRNLKAVESDGITVKTVDQVGDLISSLTDTPFSRRHIIDSWNPGTIDEMALHACHPIVQWDVTEKEGKRYLSCSFYMRSNDLFLGNPYNIAFYALLTNLLAHAYKMGLGTLTWSCGDAHIYSNHFDSVKEQLSRTPMKLPNLNLPKDMGFFLLQDLITPSVKNLSSRTENQFGHQIYVGLDNYLEQITNSLENYNPYESIKGELSTGA